MSKKRVSKRNNNNIDDAGGCGKTKEFSKSKKLYHLDLEFLHETTLKENMVKALRYTNEFKNENISYYTKPFPHCVINDFIKDNEFVNNLKEDLLKLKFHEKSTDLFQFYQTNDLGKTNSKRVTAIKDLLFTDFRQWLDNVSGIPLTDEVDLFCSKYSYTDHLLCHDDQLEGRVFAFIYYLVPPDWSTEDGGGLALFDTDANGHPADIEKTVVPSYNSLLFFQVSEKSYHQVCEVLSSSKVRVALSGWFHGNTTEIIPKDIPSTNIIKEASDAEDELLLEWVNPTYLNPDIVTDINEQFEENSEIQLQNFIIESKFVEILKELNKTSIWKTQGPVNKRNYQTYSPMTSKSNILQDFTSFISSVPFFKLLTKLTGLQLAQLDDDCDNDNDSAPPTCFYEVRKWTPGCYTLLYDDEASTKEFALDAFLHFLPHDQDDWDSDECGGTVNYLVKENGQEEKETSQDVDVKNQLLTVSPMSNCLSLVYRDNGTWSFIKYLNDRAKDCLMYDLHAVYMEGEKT